MKSKLLLLMGCAVAFSGSIMAQTSISPNDRGSIKTNVSGTPDQNVVPVQIPVRKTAVSRRSTPSKVHPNTVSVIDIGQTPNANGMAYVSRSNINYSKDLHTVAIVHRANVGTPVAAKTSGYFVMDVSNDDGATFPSNQINWGPIYSDPLPLTDGLGTYRARYPVASIYNPIGNSTLSNAYFVYSGPYTSAATSPLWPGIVWGAANLGTATSTSHYSTNGALPGFIENLFATRKGNAYHIGSDFTGADAYAGTLLLGAGPFNSSTHDFDITDAHFACPVEGGNIAFIPDMDIAFGDDGLTGYIAVIVNNDPGHLTCFPDTTLYISVYKTTDGGNHWSSNIDLDFSKAPDALLNNGPSTSYGPGLDIDVVVDKNNNLHIVTEANLQSGYAWSAAKDTWGLFDIYTTDGGTTWKGELLGKPETYGGAFGNGVGNNGTLNEYNRAFCSRTDDGSKLFFSWFDTDVDVFAGVGNIQPNLFTRGYDVNTGMWTAAVDLTSGTDADGVVTFGNGSYYVIESGTSYEIPVFYQTLVDINSTGVATDLHYIKGASVDASDFTVAGNPVNVPVSTCPAVQPPQVFSFKVGIDEVAGDRNHLSVAGNYPNPFNGTTTLVVSLPKPGDVTVEVSNMVGQVLATKTYKNLNAGQNDLTIDCTDYAAGLYLYKVKSGNDLVTNTMVVE